MEMMMRHMKKEEQKYTYAQSQQIMMQTGLIGHLRGDFGSSGNEFFTTWTDWRVKYKSDAFKDTLDEVINTLRRDGRYGKVLGSREKMAAYCREHSEGGFAGNYTTEYGFRVNAGMYAFLFRLNPSKGDYNLYCFCYLKEHLDRHMEKAKAGVRFITPNYEKRFILADGDKIRITKPSGEKRERIVRYIDETHMEIGGPHGATLYHICEFAERMDADGSLVIPLRFSLPEKCYSVSETTGKLILLTRGEPGYREVNPCPEGMTSREAADERNRKMGATKKQEAAMLAGSLFGWEVPGADPDNLDENGQFIYPKKRDRRGER